MADRKNTHVLDNSGLQTSGYITHCNFSSDGSKLAIADTAGSISFYQNNSKNQPTYLRQFNTLPNQNFNCKQLSNIHTINELGNTGFQKFVTADDYRIKVWVYDASNIFQENNFQKSNIFNSSFCSNSLKPVLKCQLNQSSTSLDINSINNNIISQDGQSITLINLETGTSIYNYTPTLSFRPPISLRSPKQPKLDYFERTQAENDFWNEIPPVTKVKFQKHHNNKFLYSNKLGQIQCIDLRLSQNNSSGLKFETPKGKSTASCCLNVVSDIALTQNDNEIISRDFLYVYKWDMKYPKTWIWRQSVYPQTNSQICQLYQQGKIYNQFSLNCNSSGNRIFTTHFEESFHQINISQQTNYRYKYNQKGNQVEKIRPLTIDNIRNSARLYETESLKCFDYDPNTNVACTATNNTIRLYCSN